MRLRRYILVLVAAMLCLAPAEKTPEQLAAIARANADAGWTCAGEMALSAVALRNGATHMARCKAIWWQGMFWWQYGFNIQEADDWLDDGDGNVNAGDDPGLTSGDFHTSKGNQYFGQGEVHMVLQEWVSARICYEAALDEFWTGHLNAFRYYEQAWQDYGEAKHDYDAAAGCYMFWYYFWLEI